MKLFTLLNAALYFTLRCFYFYYSLSEYPLHPCSIHSNTRCGRSVRLSRQMSCLGHWGALLRRADSSGAEQGPFLALDPVWASWAQDRQAGRQAALHFDGRRKAGPKGTAARKRLELHWGCSGGWGWGGMTPTGVKEEGSVWRRKEEKKASKPDKASEKQCEDCRRKRRKRREKRSVHQGERSLMDFKTFCIGQLSSWTFLKLRSTSSVAAKLSRLVDKCAVREHWACSVPWKKLGDGEESFGGTALVFFPRAVFLSKDNARELGSLFFAWHRTTLPVEFGIYPPDLSWCRLIVE